MESELLVKVTAQSTLLFYTCVCVCVCVCFNLCVGSKDWKINEIEIGSRGMYKVPMTASALDTFRLMEKRNLSGLAVVDQTGKLVGNTSGRDLKVASFSLPAADHGAGVDLLSIFL